MQCPRCNATVDERQVGASTVFSCPACGWGAEPGAPEPIETSNNSGVTGRDLVRLALYWLASILVVLGPFFAILFAVRHFTADAAEPLQNAGDAFIAGLYVHYWWVMLIYLLLALLLTPSYDPGNLGIFGGRITHNPAVTPDQHYNRLMYRVNFWLIPGRTVWITLRATGRLLRTMAPGRQSST